MIGERETEEDYDLNAYVDKYDEKEWEEKLNDDGNKRRGKKKGRKDKTETSERLKKEIEMG